MKRFCAVFVLIVSVVFTGCSGGGNQSKKTNQATKKPAYTKTILALGDSLTEGYGLEQSKTYPAQLEQSLHEQGYAHYRVVNSGLAGETSTGLLNRLNWVFRQNPDIIILTTGANDAIRGIDLRITESNIREIIETILAKNIELVFSGMEIYENLGPEYVGSFKNMYKRAAEDYKLPFINSFLANVAGNNDLNLSDRIHPNAEGYKIIVNQNILPILTPLLSNE